MNRYIILAILMLASVFITGCDKSTSNCEYDLKISKQLYEDGPYDPTTQVQQVIWDGSCLEVTFSYSGGCEDHEFEMVFNGALAESLPPIMTLGLIHNNKDLCEALITETISVDILDFSELEAYDSVYIKFKGNNTFIYLVEF